MGIHWISQISREPLVSDKSNFLIEFLTLENLCMQNISQYSLGEIIKFYLISINKFYCFKIFILNSALKYNN
jgi:hypothetical protein